MPGVPRNLESVPEVERSRKTRTGSESSRCLSPFSSGAGSEKWGQAPSEDVRSQPPFLASRPIGTDSYPIYFHATHPEGGWKPFINMVLGFGWIWVAVHVFPAYQKVDAEPRCRRTSCPRRPRPTREHLRPRQARSSFSRREPGARSPTQAHPSDGRSLRDQSKHPTEPPRPLHSARTRLDPSMIPGAQLRNEGDQPGLPENDGVH